MALAASISWEVRTTGSDSSGGGYAGNAALATPSAPTCTPAGTGGTVAAGTYYCVVAYRDANGVEGPKSAETAVTTTGATSKITFTSPPASAGAVTYSVYSITISGGLYCLITAGTAVGTDLVRTTTPPTTGTQPFGTDYSQQDGPQVVIDNSTITTSITANVITFTGYATTAADVGNIVQMLTGTNVTPGAYQITARTGNSWTVTGGANLPTSGTTTDATGNMGGALASPGKAGALHVAGNVIHVKLGTYLVTSAGTNVAGGCVRLASSSFPPTTVRGYGTIRGDVAARPTLQASGSISSFNLVLNAVNGVCYIENLILDGNGYASSTGAGIFSTGTGYAYRVKALNCTTGITVNGIAVLCEATGCVTGFNQGGGSLTAQYCVAHANTGTGFLNVYGCWGCVSVGNTGGTSDGFNMNINNGSCLWIGCTAWGNGRHGFNLLSNNNNPAWNIAANCLAVGNGVSGAGYGFTGGYHWPLLVNCAGQGNHDGDVNPGAVLPFAWQPGGAGDGFLHLGGDPFVSAAGGDFSLNNTAGAGASCRAGGIPGTFPGLATTGYGDVGAVQSQTSSAVTTQGPVIGCSFIRGVRVI